GSGTSMATPMTAAAAALIWSTPYGTSASAVRSRLETKADKIPGTGTYWSAGRVNAEAAVLVLP
ncbi:MAG: S8 family serine peptidase, partial [bacterium]|nr:S8 family serine peptidase [bacterium]